MKYIWEDLPKPLNCFTVRSAIMFNLNTGKIVNNYSANTKIVVVQKCITPNCTYYRTNEARHHYLNYAFRAADFGLPNEVAPSAPSSKPNSSINPTLNRKPKARTPSSAKKQTSTQKVILPKGGEGRGPRSWLSRIFRRKND